MILRPMDTSGDGKQKGVLCKASHNCRFRNSEEKRKLWRASSSRACSGARRTPVRNWLLHAGERRPIWSCGVLRKRWLEIENEEQQTIECWWGGEKREEMEWHVERGEGCLGQIYGYTILHNGG